MQFPERSLVAVDPPDNGQGDHSPFGRSEFAEFYAARRYPMIRLAFLITGSDVKSEEIVQEAFERLYSRGDRIENKDGYLRVVVVNGCNSWHRRRRLVRRHERDSAPPEAHFDRPDELADALASLSPKRRSMIVLRYYDHLTVPEIAATMSVSEGTVKSNLHRALRALRGTLE